MQKYIGTDEKLIALDYLLNYSNDYFFKSVWSSDLKTSTTLFIDSETKKITFSGTEQFQNELLKELGEDVG